MPQKNEKDAIGVFTVYRITLLVLTILALSGFAAAGYYAGRYQMLTRMFAEEHEALIRLQSRFQMLSEQYHASGNHSPFGTDASRTVPIPLELPSDPVIPLPPAAVPPEVPVQTTPAEEKKAPEQKPASEPVAVKKPSVKGEVKPEVKPTIPPESKKIAPVVAPVPQKQESAAVKPEAPTVKPDAPQVKTAPVEILPVVPIEKTPAPVKEKASACSDMARKIVEKKMQRSMDAVRLLLQRIGEGDMRDVEYLLSNGVGVDCAPVLHPAVKSDRLDMTLHLLSKGANVNAKSKNNMTALHLALMEKRSSHVELLLKHDPDLFSADIHGKTPLVYAIESGMMPYVTFLMEHGAPKSPEEMAAAMFAALRKPEIMALLLKKGGNVNQKYARGRTLLHSAAENDWRDAMTFLLDHGANINDRDENGMTPLHLAVAARRSKAAELLLGRKAAVDPFSNDGTPLHLAVLNAPDLIPLLLLYKANPLMPDLNGMTALLLAVKTGNSDAVPLLLKSGTPVRQISRDGRSVLHIAAQENRAELAELLIRAGADIEARDAAGKTSVFYVFGRKPGDTRFLNTLIRHNAR